MFGHTEPGSSPRVRGKHPVFVEALFNTGLIPACAGKTISTRQPQHFTLAHPRVCGENRSQQLTRLVLAGSSPRVRGKPFGLAHARWSSGLIPACAGKTFLYGTVDSPRRAHPRVCGENAARSVYALCTAGSSPRVRGKRTSGPRRRGWRGLIPACAGKTLVSHVGGPRIRAHPRVCGENKAALFSSIFT